MGSPHPGESAGIEALGHSLPRGHPRCSLGRSLSFLAISQASFLPWGPPSAKHLLAAQRRQTFRYMETVQQAFPVLGREETLWNYRITQGLNKMPHTPPTHLVHLGGLWCQFCVRLDGKFMPQWNQHEIYRPPPKWTSSPPRPQIHHTHATGNTHMQTRTCTHTHTHTPKGHPSDLLAQQEAGPYWENVGIGEPGHFLTFSKEKTGMQCDSGPWTFATHLSNQTVSTHCLLTESG